MLKLRNQRAGGLPSAPVPHRYLRLSLAQLASCSRVTMNRLERAAKGSRPFKPALDQDAQLCAQHHPATAMDDESRAAANTLGHITTLKTHYDFSNSITSLYSAEGGGHAYRFYLSRSLFQEQHFFSPTDFSPKCIRFSLIHALSLNCCSALHLIDNHLPSFWKAGRRSLSPHPSPFQPRHFTAVFFHLAVFTFTGTLCP